MFNMPGTIEVRITEASALSGLASSITGTEENCLGIFMGDEAEGYGFVIAQRQQGRPQLLHPCAHSAIQRQNPDTRADVFVNLS